MFRFNVQRMVYPEKLTLDQVSGKSSAYSARSWCNEPINHTKNKRNIKSSGDKSAVIYLTSVGCNKSTLPDSNPVIMYVL